MSELVFAGGKFNLSVFQKISGLITSDVSLSNTIAVVSQLLLESSL
jgi:hypothetical protein